MAVSTLNTKLPRQTQTYVHKHTHQYTASGVKTFLLYKACMETNQFLQIKILLTQLPQVSRWKNIFVNQILKLVVEGEIKKRDFLPGSPRGSSMTRQNMMTNTEHSDGRVPIGRSMNVCICVSAECVWLTSTCFPPQDSALCWIAPPRWWVWGPPRSPFAFPRLGCRSLTWLT